MKTLLLILLLSSSIEIPSSKVADSPTEAPLHRSALPPVSPHSGDTHRGGAILPDTFLEYPNGAEISSSPLHSGGPWSVDGGPNLRSSVSRLRSPVLSEVEASSIGHPTSDPKLNFGLVDQHLDPGAGEEASSFLPAPVTVFTPIEETASLRTSAPATSGRRSDDTQHRTSVIRHPTPLPSPVFGLPSSIPPSAFDSTSLFLRIELESSPKNSSPNLGITLSSQELDDRYDYILQVQDSLSLSPGEFLEGTMGLQLGEIKIPFQGDFGRLRIELDSEILLQNIWVQPNDSLRLSIDQRTGRLLFLGPHKEMFRLQVQLQDLASAWTKTINPIMLTSSKERILDSPEKVADYQRIAGNQSFGWNRKMEFLAEDSERLQRAKFLLNSAGQDHPVFQELIRYRDQLDPERYDWLWLYWKGKLRKQALDFMLLTQASSPEWGQLLMENALEAEDLTRLQSLREFPMEFTEALYVEHYLLEIYTGISFSHLTETLPADLQNQVNAFFLVRQYKDLADADSLISGLLDRTASPWIKEYLQGILLSNLKGRKFINEPFWNEQGDPVYPESWKGKLVFLDFWLSGCGACLAFAKNKFLPLLEEFGSHPDILFVTITGDSDRELWKSTLAKNQLTTAQTQDLFAGGVTHPALKQYHIQAFPEQLLLDKEGKILQVGGFPSDLQGWKELLQNYLAGDHSKLTSLTQPQSN